MRKHCAELVDLSVAGCRVRSPFAILPGRALVIRIADLSPLLAVVRWCTASEVGLEFTRALDPRVVERISRNATDAGRS